MAFLLGETYCACRTSRSFDDAIEVLIERRYLA
jgi:hypothetical protein